MNNNECPEGTSVIEKNNVVPEPMVTFDGKQPVVSDPLSREEGGETKNVLRYSYDSFAREFSARNSIVKIQGILYLYLQERGYYHPVVVGAVDIAVRMQIPKDMQNRCNNSTINEMIKWLYAWIEEYQGAYNRAEYVNFKNGYLDIVTGKFFPHSSDAVFTYTLNVEYVFDVKKTPVFDEFLANICSGLTGLDRLLAEHFGYVISSIRSVKLISVFYGPSNTGKSTWLELLNMAVGDDFTRAIPLQNLGGNFRTIELLGLRLNTFSEIDDFKLSDTYMIKTLSSGGDRINCDVKNGKPIDFVNLAALVFATNTLENFKMIGRKDAIFQRLLIMPFLNQISNSNRIRGLKEKLQGELPYIIKKFVLPGLMRFYHNNFEFTDTALIEQMKTDLLKSENSVYKFVAEFCEFGEDLRVSTVELFAYYRNYCYNNDLKCVNKTEFFECVDIVDRYFELSFPILRKRVRMEGDNTQGYVGIGIK